MKTSRLPPVSRTAVKLFTAYSAHYVRRRFHSIRILREGLPRGFFGGALLIYLNHASWWDPLVCLLLSQKCFPQRSSFGPIDEKMLERYSFFKRLGFYAVGSARGFLEETQAILDSPHNAVWITPQGRFADVRERPVELRGGLRALASRVPGAAFVPLAIEYAFWSEPQPEILVSFGAPVDGTDFGAALEAAQDALAAASCRREPAEWIVLDRGASGVNAIYDGWRWLRAQISGERFVREHGQGATR